MGWKQHFQGHIFSPSSFISQSLKVETGLNECGCCKAELIKINFSLTLLPLFIFLVHFDLKFCLEEWSWRQDHCCRSCWNAPDITSGFCFMQYPQSFGWDLFYVAFGHSWKNYFFVILIYSGKKGIVWFSYFLSHAL